MAEFQDLLAKIRDKNAVVGVIGLGYVGLPLAVAFAEAGLVTVGFDVSAEKVTNLSQGISYIDDVDSSRVGDLVSTKRMSVTSDATDLGSCDAVFICVPTPFDKAKTPDLSFVRAAARTIAQVLRSGMLIVLQSTTYPGTTNQVVRPILESETGLVAGRDFFIAFSPERVDPGNKTWNVSNTPKVVGGLTSECLEVAKTLLEAIVQDPGYVVPVSTPEAAEMAKILENTYRAVNIALVNELAVLAHQMGIDIWEVIEAASSKPFGFQKFLPGIGPGGHCIPIDPHYLAWKAREFDFQTQFIEIAADVNSGMASYAVQRAQDLLNDRAGKALSGARILCLGAAFKPGVSDIRHSRAIRVMELLLEKGASISYSDPMVPEIEVSSDRYMSLELRPEIFGDFDLVMILVGGDWPVAQAVNADVLVFDAVNASGSNQQGVHRL
jgi:UDP-N-acetyl-D-glucosamine dehydrogenase